MTKMAVVGGSEFVLGFQLAGIKDAIETDSAGITGILKDIRKNKEIGIVVVDEMLAGHMDKRDRMELEASANPVFVMLSTKESQDNLRQLIKKSIGVDLLAQ